MSQLARRFSSVLDLDRKWYGQTQRRRAATAHRRHAFAAARCVRSVMRCKRKRLVPHALDATMYLKARLPRRSDAVAPTTKCRCASGLSPLRRSVHGQRGLLSATLAVCRRRRRYKGSVLTVARLSPVRALGTTRQDHAAAQRRRRLTATRTTTIVERRRRPTTTICLYDQLH